MSNLKEQSKNIIPNKQTVQSFQKHGLVDWLQEERIPLATNLKLNFLKVRQVLVKIATNKLIRQKEEIRKQIEELSKQQEELNQEEDELRKRKELESLSEKEVKLKKTESYNVVVLSKDLPPLDKELNLSEVKFVKRLRRYQHILAPIDLRHYGYPVVGYLGEGSVSIYKHRFKRRNQSNYSTRCLLEHVCIRCARPFHVDVSGEYFTKENCIYHWGKFKERFTCCGGEKDSEGCERNKLHVWNGIIDGDNGPYKDFLCTQPRPDKSDVEAKVYALDCEMCYTGRGLEVARVSLVGYDGQVVYDHFVKPTCEVVDYCTRFSGVTARDLCKNQNKNLKTFAEVQKDLLQLIDADTILIGHSMENDLRVLKIVHKTVVDTADEFPHPLGFPYRHSLKNLTKEYLKRDIQCGNNGHDSVEDSRACLELIMWKVRNKMPPKRPKEWIK
ncbi:exonuclease GOR-like [Bactrocera neohumeralis]|uniref:exonuclease GOR-like n=1 Tax=Bactrocera neohumeralis TaxID=98809 RepID=UPI00216673BB|nr:exonuclease GOR-like [Bactrocera neohumeralis]